MEPERCFESRNTSCLKTSFPIPLRVALYIIYGVIIILTVCGNLLVIVSVAYFKQLHIPTNYLISSLAMSDLLLGIFIMFPFMIQTVESCWYFGDLFCKVFLSSGVTLCTASILNLSFISVDRYFAVCQPLLYRIKMSVKVVFIMILICWSISISLGFGMVFIKLNTLVVDESYYNHVECEGECLLFQSGVSNSISSAVAFYLPGIIMVGVYLKIFFVAQRQFRSIQNSGCVNSVKPSNTGQTKATKTLAVVMGAFLCFWTPFFICNIIDPHISYSTPPAFLLTLGWLGCLNSTVNPMIYAFFYSWFRKAFKLLTSGHIFKSDISQTTLFTE